MRHRSCFAGFIYLTLPRDHAVLDDENQSDDADSVAGAVSEQWPPLQVHRLKKIGRANTLY